MSIIKYEHHSRLVSVQEHLKGRHREHCLCYQNCRLFKPDTKDNCIIAANLYKIDQHFGVTTPVWECSRYDGRGDEEFTQEDGRDNNTQGD